MPHVSRSSWVRAAAALALSVSAGCFSYTTVPSLDGRPGAEVRVALAEGGAADLARWVGPRAVALDGRVVAQTDTGLTLAVSGITRTSGVDETWPGDEVTVPRAAIASVQTRRLARGRTGLLLAGLVALGVAVAAAFTAIEDINRGGTRTPGGSPR